MTNNGLDCQEFYECVKRDRNAIVMDVGEPHPVIIHEADMLIAYKDGSKGYKTLYTTFEYVKKHLKKFKRCPCEACQGAIAAYRINRKVMRGEAHEAVVPDSWERVIEN